MDQAQGNFIGRRVAGACRVLNRYQTKGWSGDFSETQLSADTFMANLAANAFTSQEKPSDFAILRTADKSEISVTMWPLIMLPPGGSGR